MSPDPASPSTLNRAAQTEPPQDVKAAGAARRRSYTAPRLKQLGSVRDLTLGSPALPFGDGRGGFQRVPM